MAKRKAAVLDEIDIDIENEENNEEIKRRIIKDIEKELGKGVIISGREILDRPKMLIPVGPAINQITGGGIPEGSWVILSGKEKLGKSLTALHFAKNCQRPEYGSRNIYYLNVEARLKKRDILGIEGLDPDKINIIESTEKRILTAEDYLTTAANVLHTDKRCVIIIDSVSQLVAQRAQDGGVGTQTRGSGGILVSDFTSQMGPVVNVKNAIVICILQHRHNTSGKGSPIIEKGGWAIQYQVDVKLFGIGGPKFLAETEGADPYGQIVTWQCKSTGTSMPPNRTCESYLRYGEGIDETTELIVDASDIGLIGGGGTAWLSFDFLANHLEEIGLSADTEWNDETKKKIGARVNGKNAARKALKENPLWMKILEEDIRRNL